jgi:hypothetical protein
MPTKIGHFEILSELAKSETGTVYKANDPQSGQTIALKAILLSIFGESAADLETALLAEAESTKVLSSPNVVAVFGAGKIEDQFCAAMEYVQGNSVSTMLERHEGFSIWDLLDIGRQVCSGLDHAHSHQVFHHSLEPAKIMCGWDGTVKILGFGISSVGRFAPQTAQSPVFLPYMSPEQIRGEAIDARSNLFTLGAMFYEMVTERKPFDGPNTDALCQSIVEATPIPPVQLNAKIHPLLSQLIMKTLEKNPAQRYQSGRELLEDLEKCKESKAQAANAPIKAPAKAPAAVPGVVKVAAQSKFAAPAAAGSQSATAAGASSVAAKTAVAKVPEKPAPTYASSKLAVPPPPAPGASPSRAAAAQAAAPPSVPAPAALAIKVSRINTTIEATETSSAYSSAVVEEPVETFAANSSGGKVAVDPMMAEGAGRGNTTSFSEISELPPLKEIYVEPAPPPPAAFAAAPVAAAGATMYQDPGEDEEKPKVQPREVAQKAIKEIKNVPPQLLLYSIAGAAVLILAIAIGLVWHIHSLNSEDDSGAARTSTEAPAATQPATPAQNAAAQPAIAPAIEVNRVPAEPADTANSQPATAARARAPKIRNKKAAAAPAAPIVIPGQMVLDSTPQGAQVEVDGRTDPSYVTPFLLPGMAAGAHTITVSKSGYTSDTRSVEIASGNKTSLVIHLAQLVATLSVTSNPAGANVFIDGRDTGKTTPAQVSVDKGQHVVLIRKMGFLDEAASQQFVLGQTVSLSPALRPLGNADDIRTVGKMKKLFGGKGAEAGQLTVSIKTQPKGAQVTINQHMLEKSTPVDAALDPGNYVIDITLTGYAPIHKVVTAEKGSKLVVEEVMQKQ